MTRLFSRRPSPALVVAFVALLAALSGTAAALPGGNSVDSGDLKRGAVKRSDIARNAVSGPKVKNDSVRGADVLESSLASVPNADRAGAATTADVANSIAPSEGYREVGTPGNPSFAPGCGHLIAPPPTPDVFERVAFYKDREGVVHLRGAVQCAAASVVAFQLPEGYRPRAGRLQAFNTLNGAGTGTMVIEGAGVPLAGTGVPQADGAVVIGDAMQLFDGVSFRAEG